MSKAFLERRPRTRAWKRTCSWRTLGIERLELYMRLEPLLAAEVDRARELGSSRAARTDRVHRATGSSTDEFQVGPGVLVPRPETEPVDRARGCSQVRGALRPTGTGRLHRGDPVLELGERGRPRRRHLGRARYAAKNSDGLGAA